MGADFQNCLIVRVIAKYYHSVQLLSQNRLKRRSRSLCCSRKSMYSFFRIIDIICWKSYTLTSKSYTVLTKNQNANKAFFSPKNRSAPRSITSDFRHVATMLSLLRDPLGHGSFTFPLQISSSLAVPLFQNQLGRDSSIVINKWISGSIL